MYEVSSQPTFDKEKLLIPLGRNWGRMPRLGPKTPALWFQVKLGLGYSCDKLYVDWPNCSEASVMGDENRFPVGQFVLVKPSPWSSKTMLPRRKVPVRGAGVVEPLDKPKGI